MTNVFAGARENPFENDVVREPREIPVSLSGLNEAPLRALVARFGELDAKPPPRPPVGAAKAQLVVSPDQGYGKSHLLGRLFAALSDRAMSVYLRPFEDADKAWQSILLTTVRELARVGGDDRSGLESMAVATLAFLSADSITHDDGLAPAEVATIRDYLRRLGGNPAQAGADGRSAIANPELFARLSRGLAHAGLELDGRERAWISALAALARGERHSEAWGAALKWLRAEPLDAAEATTLGLNPADRDAPEDATPAAINQLSFARLRGLCKLAVFYRPFLFCFDQTEAYGGDVALINALGKCVERLFADLPNQMTVITANQANWVDEIRPHMQLAQQKRIADPLELEGVGASGARDLVAGRLKAAGFGETDVAEFLADGWVDGVFANLPELGVRQALSAAATRFQALAKAPPSPKKTLDALFGEELAVVRADRARQSYDQDALMWFVKHLGPAAAEPARGSKYFTLRWSAPGRDVLFGFEGGDNHLRWGAISREAVAKAGARSGERFAAYVLRTPDLPTIPRASWSKTSKDLREAEALGFRIVTLTRAEVCDLHAARELHSNALQGNIPFAGAETLTWLKARFRSFAAKLAASDARPPVPPAEPAPAEPAPAAPQPVAPPTAAPELQDGDKRRIVDLVHELRLVDAHDLLSRLGKPASLDPLLVFANSHRNLKAHTGPQSTFIQWRH